MKKTQLLMLAVVCLASAFAGEAPGAENANESSQANAASSQPASPKAQTPAEVRLDDPDKLNVAIYPLFGWLPSFSSSVSIPPFTDGGGNTEGTTGRTLNGAWGIGGGITVNKWLVEGEATFVKASALRTTPQLEVNNSLGYGDLFVGRYVGKGFYALGGFRRMSLDFEVKVASGNTFTREIGTWDPLVGIEWRKALGRKVLVQGRFDGGGFGVGTDVDVSAQGRLEWRFIKHMGAVIGYQFLHTRSSGTISRTIVNTSVSYPWTYNQTFVGPIIGVGIYF